MFQKYNFFIIYLLIKCLGVKYLKLFTVLKEEPDDLTHLAPTAGDACIPLDDSTPLFGEMFDGLILPDGYGTLLPDDMNTLDTTNNKNNIDPFMNYREESCDTIGTPNLLSPGSLPKVIIFFYLKINYF